MSIFADKNFKKDKYIDKDGYVMVKMPLNEDEHLKPMYKARGYAFEHRLNMARQLGRSLRSDETVHHKDKNRQNNDPSNLEVILRRNHHFHHRDSGDYKLFSKSYQPRWNMKKQAGFARKALYTLGGAAIGNVPALVTYLKAKKLDDPEKQTAQKRKALEQSIAGSVAGAYTGFVGERLVRNTTPDIKRVFDNYKHKKPSSKILGPAIGAGVGGGYGAYKMWKARKIEDPNDKEKEMTKAKKLMTMGSSLGSGLGLLNSLTK